MANTLIFTLLGKDKLSPAMQSAGKSTEGFGKKLATVGGIIAGAVGVTKIIGFGKSSVEAFQNTAVEVLKLQRIAGGTAEQMSRLRFAAEHSGVSVDILTNSTRLFGRNLVAAQGSTKKTAELTKALGFDFLDAHGKVKPMTDLLPQVADRFQKMPAGAEKTALAMKLFGRSGANMLPFLNKGSAGLKALGEESDKVGTTMSGKNLQALINYRKQQRDFGASMLGLKLAIGGALLPVMTRIGAAINGFIAGIRNGTGAGGKFRAIVQNLADGFKRDILPRLQEFGKFLTGTVIPALVSLGTSIVKTVGPPLRSVFGFVGREVLPKLISFGQWVGTNTGLLKGLAIGIGTLLVITKAHTTAMAAQAAITKAGGLLGYIKNIKIVAAATKLWTAVQWALNLAFSPIGLVVIGVGLLVAGIIIAYKHSARFRAAVDAVGNALKTGFLAAVHGVTTAIHAVGDAFHAVGSAIGKAIDFLKDNWKRLPLLLLGPIGLVLFIWKSLPGKILDALGNIGAKIAKPFRAIGSAIADAARGVGRWIKSSIIDPITAPFRAAAKWLEPVWPHLLIGLKHGIELALKPAQLIYDHVIRPIANAFAKASTWLVDKGKDILVGLFNGILSLANTIGKWENEHIIGPVVNAFSKAGTWLYEKGRNLVAGLKNGIVNIAKAIGSWVHDNIISPVVNTFSKAGTWLYEKGRNLVAGLKNGIVNIAVTISRWTYEHISKPILDAFSAAGTWLLQRGKDIVTGLKNGVSNIIKAGKGIGRWFYDNVISPAVKPFIKAGTWLFQHGKNLIAGLKDGVVAIMKDIGNWIHDHIYQPIIDKIKWFFGISSPSKVFADLGGNMVKGLFKGLGSINIGKAVVKIFGGMPAALRAIVNRGIVALKDLPKKARDALGSAVGIHDPIGGPSSIPKDRAGMVTLMRTVASQYGWGTGPQWDALYKLEMGEAGFNPNAKNPTSTAYGLGQFLDTTWAETGISKTSDPWAQAKAMMIYIARRYGSPDAAWSAWQSRQPHWYDQGGWLMPGMVGVNATTEPEAVFTRAQLGNLLGGSRRLHPDDLAALMSAVSRVDVSVDEGTLRGVIRVEAKKLDDRQASRLASGRR